MLIATAPHFEGFVASEFSFETVLSSQLNLPVEIKRSHSLLSQMFLSLKYVISQFSPLLCYNAELVVIILKRHFVRKKVVFVGGVLPYPLPAVLLCNSGARIGRFHKIPVSRITVSGKILRRESLSISDSS